MEFRFNVNEIFKQPIVEINSSLIPPGLSLADKRALWDAVGKVSDVVNTMGEASASAQGLTKAITTSDRLRNSEHRLYLLIDQNSNNGKGGITGMLKTGKKGLYVFDRDGHHYQVSPSCVLDFYIHESKQRMGLGRKLFEHMLEKEHVEPVKMAIDRPSDKFLGFLNKHYSLDNPVKQMNNFVVFDGFFPEGKKNDMSDNNNTPLGKSNQAANGLQSNYNTSPYGRYGAPRPPCSMGQIIHNQSPLAQPPQEAAGLSLNIRAPTKTRSVYSEKQPINSGNAQTYQSMPNLGSQNQNTNATQYHNSQQNNYHPDQQIYQNQNQYTPPQTQQQQHPNQHQYNTHQQNQYPQANIQYPQHQNQPIPQQNLYQQQIQQNPITPTHLPSSTQFQQGQHLQQNQYIPNTPPSRQQYQAAPNIAMPHQGDSGTQVQRKKSVQFAPLNQTAHQTQSANYQPTQMESAHDTRYAQSMIDYQQPPSNVVHNAHINQINTQERDMQQINQSMQQQMQNPNVVPIQYPPQQPLPTVYESQQPVYQQQLLQSPYQLQQPSETAYQTQQVPQPQPVTQTQPQYSNNQPFITRQQYQHNIQEQPLSEKQQVLQGVTPSAQRVTPSAQNVTPSTQNVTPTQNMTHSLQNIPSANQNINTQQRTSEVTNQMHQTPMVHQNQQIYSANQNDTPPNAYYQPRTSPNEFHSYQSAQNVPNPASYPINQQSSLTQQPTPNPNIINYQQTSTPSTPNIQTSPQMQYSQQNMPPSPQMYPQIQQQIDPSMIVPPVEPINDRMTTPYQYYDSNLNRMQNSVTDNAKQASGMDPAKPPNASGDMQPVAE